MAKQTIEIATRPGTIPVLCYIEDLPFGKILRQLHDTQGIVTVDVLLGQGGRQSPLTPEDIQTARGNGSTEKQVIEVLARGPTTATKLARELGYAASRYYAALATLRKKGVAEKGTDGWRLTAQAMAYAKGNGHDAAPIALPAPSNAAKGRKGRATHGASTPTLLATLSDGPKTPAQISQAIAAAGMSAKSISGVLARARTAGIIKHDPKSHLYELTARGVKQAGEAAHG